MKTFANTDPKAKKKKAAKVPAAKNKKGMSKAKDEYISGRWLKAEVDYFIGLYHYFKKGILENVPNGITWRKYVAEVLCCKDKRISKRFEGFPGYNGRHLYACQLDKYTEGEILQAKRDLDDLYSALLAAREEYKKKGPGYKVLEADQKHEQPLRHKEKLLFGIRSGQIEIPGYELADSYVVPAMVDTNSPPVAATENHDAQVAGPPPQQQQQQQQPSLNQMISQLSNAQPGTAASAQINATLGVNHAAQFAGPPPPPSPQQQQPSGKNVPSLLEVLFSHFSLSQPNAAAVPLSHVAQVAGPSQLQEQQPPLSGATLSDVLRRLIAQSSAAQPNTAEAASNEPVGIDIVSVLASFNATGSTAAPQVAAQQPPAAGLLATVGQPQQQQITGDVGTALQGLLGLSSSQPSPGAASHRIAHSDVVPRQETHQVAAASAPISAAQVAARPAQESESREADIANVMSMVENLSQRARQERQNEVLNVILAGASSPVSSDPEEQALHESLSNALVEVLAAYPHGSSDWPGLEQVKMLVRASVIRKEQTRRQRQCEEQRIQALLERLLTIGANSSTTVANVGPAQPDAPQENLLAAWHAVSSDLVEARRRAVVEMFQDM